MKNLVIVSFFSLSLLSLFVAGRCFGEEPIMLPGSTNVVLKERALPPRHDQCHLCHIKKKKFFVLQKFETLREHNRVEAAHGDVILSCNNCHDMNRNNYLISPKSPQASFSNTSPVCKRCHAAIYRDWTEGVHGQRIGEWSVEKVQFHCIDCHDPHSVRFKKMQSVDVPGTVSDEEGATH